MVRNLVARSEVELEPPSSQSKISRVRDFSIRDEQPTVPDPHVGDQDWVDWFEGLSLSLPSSKVRPGRASEPTRRRETLGFVPLSTGHEVRQDLSCPVVSGSLLSPVRVEESDGTREKYCMRNRDPCVQRKSDPGTIGEEGYFTFK